MDNDFSLLAVLKVLGKWKKHIIKATIAVAILSVIGSLMMPNYYQSTTTFYAAHPDLARPEPIGGGGPVKYIYGTNEDLDRLFSIANSGGVRNYLVDKFNLYSHYNIDSTSVKGKAKMNKKFSKLYNTLRTKYDAMTVSMEDTDRQLAKDIVTAARERISARAQELVKRSQKKTLETSLVIIENQRKSLIETQDSLIKIKKEYNIFGGSQGEVLAEMITEGGALIQQKEGQLISMKQLKMPRDSVRKVTALLNGLKRKQISLVSTDSLYREGILRAKSLEGAQGRMADELSLEMERYKKLKQSYDSPFQSIHLVEKEEVPVEKSRPKRSLLVVGLTLIGFILSCLGALLVEGTKDINWREIYNG